MGRVATADGAAGLHTSGLDRSAPGAIHREQGSTGDPALGTSGTGPALSGPAADMRQTTPEEEPAGQEVVLRDVWSLLPPSERLCFGHRFSGMVLKASGLRPAREVKQ
jgi:hypothetical protein